MEKFLETKKFFQKILENFQPPSPGTKKFLAAAEGQKKLKISSRRRRRERHQLTPLLEYNP
jgi:hypothetical protein